MFLLSLAKNSTHKFKLEVAEVAVVGVVLGVVAGTGQRYGATHIVDILRGGSSDKITRGGHDRLPEYGAGVSRKVEEWRSIVRQLVATHA